MHMQVRVRVRVRVVVCMHGCVGVCTCVPVCVRASMPAIGKLSSCVSVERQWFECLALTTVVMGDPEGKGEEDCREAPAEAPGSGSAAQEGVCQAVPGTD